MTFGFPAYYTEHFETDANIDLRTAVRKTFASLSWNVNDETTSTISAVTSVGIRSSRDIVTIHFISPQSISVKSQCSLPTRCFDFGKNKANVSAFLIALKKHID